MEFTKFKTHYCTYILLEDGTAELAQYKRPGGKATTVPAKTRHTLVTAIGVRAFAWHDMLHHVTISNGITTIGNSAFSGCVHLKKVVIPDSVTSIGKYTFDI